MLVVGAWPALGEVGFAGFLFAADWQPLSERYGLASMMASTLAVSAGGGSPVAGPLAVLSALFAAYYAGPLVARSLSSGCLAPAREHPLPWSNGLWGIVVLIPMIAQIAPPGASVLAGVVVLSLMILPTIAVVVHNGLVQLPPNHLPGRHRPRHDPADGPAPDRRPGGPPPGDRRRGARPRPGRSARRWRC